MAERFAREGYSTALFANSGVLNMGSGFAQGVQLIDTDAPLHVFGWQIRGAGNYRLGEWLQQLMTTSLQPEVPIRHARSFLADYTDRPVFAWIQSQIPDHLTVDEYREHVERIDRELGDFVRIIDNRPVERKSLLIITASFGTILNTEVR